MNKMFNGFSKLFLAGVGVLSINAIASPRISVFGLGNYMVKTVSILGAEVKGDFGYGGGLALELPVSSSAAFEVDAAYQQQKFKTTFLGETRKSSVASIHIPAGLRFNLGSGKVSALVGGYYDYSLEDNGENDYGAVAGLRIRCGGAFFVEPRFRYGFSDDVLDGMRDAQLLVGWSFGGMKK